MTVDERKKRIMQAIVTLYALEGEPIGSGVLANYLDFVVSSATLRNEMAALTKLGLLEQPHTSAGRIPSAKGYRYYLDNLMTAATPLSGAERSAVSNAFASLDLEPNQLAQGAARLLAQTTGYTAAVTRPRADDLCVAHFEVVQVGRYAAAVLAVTGVGGVRTRVAHIGNGLTRSDASQLAALLNSSLTFVAPVDLNRRLLQAVYAEAGEAFAPVVRAAAAILQESAQPHVFLGGEQYLLQWPEMQSYVPELLAALNDDEQAVALVAAPQNRTCVLLGEDFEPALPGTCIITTRYRVGGGLTGNIALVGPARMPFAKLIPLLEAFADELGRGMAGRTKEDET